MTAPAPTGPAAPDGRPRRRGLYGLLVADAISVTGSRVSMVAIPWLVLTTTGSAAQTGLVAFAEMLPFVIAQVVGGPLVDRLGGRRVAVACNAVSAAVTLTIPLLYDGGRLPFWALCLLVAVLGVFRGPGQNAGSVLVPDVVAEARIPLERGAGLHDGVNRAGSLVGAPLGGALAATIGAGNALFVDAASFLVAAVLIGLLVRTRPHAASVEEAGGAGGAGGNGAARPATVTAAVGGYLGRLREGLAYAFRDPLLRAIALLILVTNLFDQAMVSVLMPVWARDVTGSATAIGLVGGVFGLGAVLGGLGFSAVAHRVPRRIVFAACFLIAGGPRYLAMAFSHDLWPVLVVSAISGLACGSINPLLGAAEYERVPDRLRARVLGAVNASAWAGIPFGGLLAGWLVAWAGLVPSLLVFGGAYVAANLVPFFAPSWRLMDRDRIRPPDPAAPVLPTRE